MTDLEDRLVAAFGAARIATAPNPDLFARVSRSVDDAWARRRWRRRASGGVAGYIAVLGALAFSFGELDNGRFTMSWWLIELLTNIVLVTIAVVLGPFIKRFGRSYAADVFRANPRTGKSYLVLTDVAYYLIFTAFILFTINFEDIWDVRADQWKSEVGRLGGILLIMGLLHAANVVALPVIGQMLSATGLERKSDQPSQQVPAPLASSSSPPLAAGTWIVRLEQAGGTSPTASAPDDVVNHPNDH